MNDFRHTLPGKYYTSPEIYNSEMDRFYFNRWVCVGRSEELGVKGQFIVREVGSESILMMNDGNQIGAFYNVCRHRGTRLSNTACGIAPGRIQCAYHGWTYQCDGTLAVAPGMTEVQGFDRTQYGLNRIALDVWDGNLFIHFGKNPRPLSEQLGGLRDKFRPWGMGDLRMAGRRTYTLATNWKLVIQNYSECLHCPLIHPALQKLSHYLSGDNEPAQATYLGGRMVLNEGIRSMTLSGDSHREVLPGLDAELSRHVYYYWIMPNLLLSLHPDYVMTHTLWPRAAGQTEIVCEFHFHPSEMEKPGFCPDDAIEFWNLTNLQDWRVSELTQLGVASRGFVPGPYSPREELLWGLDEIVVKTTL